MHSVEDIGISTWAVGVFDFGADAYAHRKQTDVKQLYNQVPQTAWVSQFKFQLQLESVGTRWESACRLRTQALREPRLSSPARMRKKCCYGQKNSGSICSKLSPSPTHLSHTTNINPFENNVWEVYFFIMKCVRSFIEVRLLCWLCFRLYLYMYCVVVCGYTTQVSYVFVGYHLPFRHNEPVPTAIYIYSSSL